MKIKIQEYISEFLGYCWTEKEYIASEINGGEYSIILNKDGAKALGEQLIGLSLLKRKNKHRLYPHGIDNNIIVYHYDYLESESAFEFYFVNKMVITDEQKQEYVKNITINRNEENEKTLLLDLDIDVCQEIKIDVDLRRKNYVSLEIDGVNLMLLGVNLFHMKKNIHCDSISFILKDC